MTVDATTPTSHGPERDAASHARAPKGSGSPPPALLVVGHGSRDPLASAELDRLVAVVAGLLPGIAVGAGCLELAEPHIDDALDTLVAGGATDIVAVPVVLFGAGHLKDDGPALLGRARRRHPQVRFRLARDLGVHPAVLAVAEDRARAALRRAELDGCAAPLGDQSGAEGAATGIATQHDPGGPGPAASYRSDPAGVGDPGTEPERSGRLVPPLRGGAAPTAGDEHDPPADGLPGAEGEVATAADPVGSDAPSSAQASVAAWPVADGRHRAGGGAATVPAGPFAAGSPAESSVAAGPGADAAAAPRAASASEAATAVVLVGRGSTDPDACAEMVKLARLLEDGRGLGSVEAAFAAMSPPGVEAALERCRRLGAERVAVVPLFLFAGVLVERVAERATAWAAQHPEVEVAVGGHLGPDRRLAALVVERYREACTGDVRMNCDLCVYRVRLPGFEEKLGTPLSLSPPERAGRGWRARRAANQEAERAAQRRERPRTGLGRRRRLAPAPERTGPAVRVKGLAHTFPDGTRALAGVDLVVEQGQRVAVLGPNGSGKTTLALHLIGALERREGTVSVTGVDVEQANLAEVRRRVGFVFQDPDDQLLLPTVADDVAFGPRNLGLADSEVTDRVAAALDVVGLTDLADRAPQHLSLGERRRAALAGVLAVHPEVLVLDEPSANLDPAARRDLVEVVGALDVTTLVITHDLSLALELCPRSVVLDHGVVAADGSTRALLSNPGLLQAHRLDLPFGMVVTPVAEG